MLLAPVMTLRDRTTAGEIGANTINVGPGVVTGPRSAYVAPPAAPAIAAFTVGTTAVTVNAGQTQTLARGNTAAVTVNGTLNLSGGVYEMQSLRIGPDGRAAAVASATCACRPASRSAIAAIWSAAERPRTQAACA